MGSVLKNVIRFTGLAVGVSVSSAHQLNYNGRAVKPDNVWLNGGGYSVSVDANNVTIERQPSGQAAVDMSLELWHSYEDAEPQPGGIATSVLPFIMQGIGGSAPVGGGVQIAAGTQTAATGTVNFAASNGYSFGLSGSSQLTMSGDALRSVIALGSTATGPTLSFVNTNGVTFGMNGQTLTASVQTVGGTATGVAISAGTEVATTGAVIFSNSNGMSFGLNAQTMTATYAALRTISANGGSVTNGQLSFANSNNISFGINAGTITGSVFQPALQRTVGFTAAGGETQATVTFAPAAASSNYAVMGQLAGVSRIFGFDIPALSQGVSSFVVIPSGSMVAGDAMRFMLFQST